MNTATTPSLTKDNVLRLLAQGEIQDIEKLEVETYRIGVYCDHDIAVEVDFEVYREDEPIERVEIKRVAAMDDQMNVLWQGSPAGAGLLVIDLINNSDQHREFIDSHYVED